MTLTKLSRLFSKKNIDFHKNGRLNSHKKASNQGNVKICNEPELLFYWSRATFSEMSSNLQ